MRTAGEDSQVKVACELETLVGLDDGLELKVVSSEKFWVRVILPHYKPHLGLTPLYLLYVGFAMFHGKGRRRVIVWCGFGDERATFQSTNRNLEDFVTCTSNACRYYLLIYR